MIKAKRVTLFLGHYGSGKTNVAVNYALRLKADGRQTCIADLDIVNPYFRTKDSEKELAGAGVELISPAFANTNVDLPALPSELYSLFQRRDKFCVLDVGGDDRGAYALGRYVPYISEENDFEAVFVANFYRPLTRSAGAALEVLCEIEAACRLPVTGIVNNSNLGCETTREDVLKTEKEACRLCAAAGVPLLFTSVEKRAAADFTPEEAERLKLFPLTLQKKIFQ